jgi:2-dehydropantoate 2-reductase
MNVLVMGAGGVGGYLGGMLQAAGNEVTFVARGAHLEALRANGLELRRDGALLSRRPVKAIAAPAEAESEFDLVLFTVKTYDTAEAAEALKPVVGPNTAVLTLQNGVDSVEELGAILGPEHLIAGTIVIFAAIKAPGVVEQTSPACRVALAQSSGDAARLVERIAETLRQAGAEVTAGSDVQRVLWEKFASLAVFATITAACDLPHGNIRTFPEGLALYRELLTEMHRVARASGVPIADDFVEDRMAYLMALPAAVASSLQHDFATHHRVELEALTGSVVRHGRRAGVATPAFDALYAVLKARALAYGGL